MSKTISQLADQLDTEFDKVIHEGSDDELFASGYLRGHFDLVVAQLTMSGQEDVEVFWPTLDQSLEKNAKELDKGDWELVQKMLKKLRKTVEHPALN